MNYIFVCEFALEKNREMGDINIEVSLPDAETFSHLKSDQDKTEKQNGWNKQKRPDYIT